MSEQLKQPQTWKAELPVGVDDLAEGEFTAHLQVTLVFRKLTAGTPPRIHLTVLIRLVQGLDELTCGGHTGVTQGSEARGRGGNSHYCRRTP